MTDKRGKFITLEGLEGVGKTSNRQLIEDQLSKADIAFIGTREPGGTDIGERLRELVLHADGTIQAETELLIMAASRLEHVERLIEPALKRGEWVLCDRYLDASVAYQGAGRQLGAQRVVQLHELMGLTLKPDLTLLLDMPVEAGLERMAARGKPDRIERESLAFFERAREAYLQRAKSDPDRVKVIDASRSLDVVGQEVAMAVQLLIDAARPSAVMKNPG